MFEDRAADVAGWAGMSDRVVSCGGLNAKVSPACTRLSTAGDAVTVVFAYAVTLVALTMSALVRHDDEERSIG